MRFAWRPTVKIRRTLYWQRTHIWPCHSNPIYQPCSVTHTISSANDPGYEASDFCLRCGIDVRYIHRPTSAFVRTIWAHWKYANKTNPWFLVRFGTSNSTRCHPVMDWLYLRESHYIVEVYFCFTQNFFWAEVNQNCHLIFALTGTPISSMVYLQISSHATGGATGFSCQYVENHAAINSSFNPLIKRRYIRSILQCHSKQKQIKFETVS